LVPRIAVAALVVLLVPAISAPAAALSSKLDARARASLACLRAGRGSIEQMRRSGASVDRDGALEVFIRGTVSRRELELAGARVHTALPGLFTASLPASVVERVAALPAVTAIRAGAPCAPELDMSVPTTGAQLLRGAGPGFAGLAGQGVIIGIVDTGVDYHHGDFQDSTGATRILSIWDQSASGTGFPGFPYGKEWTRSEIDLGLCSETDSLEHGTHSAGIATGDGSQTGGTVPRFTYAGMAPRADLVVVKTDFLAPEVIDAVRYVFARATALGKNAVVNLSLGTQYGSHDGNSEFEQGLNALLGPGRIVVKSAGNDRGKAIHAQVFATSVGASATLAVTGSGLNRYFEIDGYYNATERLRVKLRSPNGTTIGPLAVNSENAPWPGQTTSNGTIYLAHDSLSSGRKNVYLQVQIDKTNANMNGTWTITLLADQLGAANGETDLWRYIADPNVSADFVSGNLPTQELISEPGNAPDVITVGAWVTKTSWTGCNGMIDSYSGIPTVGNLAPFSSPGPTRDGRLKPDLVAPGTAVGSATSFDLAHVCPAAPALSELLDDGMNHRVYSGTSLSAPHVTGAVALLMQKFGAMTPAQIKSYLRTHALTDGFTGTVPSKDWGYGKLGLGDLVDPVAHVVQPNGGEILAQDEVVRLNWTATDALGGVTGVDLQLSRTGPAGPFENIAVGVPNSGSHSWTVTAPATGGYDGYLRVVAHDGNGNTGIDLSDGGFAIAGPVGVGDGEAPPAFALSGVIPNPTAGAAQVEFSLARESHIRLAIVDIQGRTITVLAEGFRPAGRHHAAWDGRRGGTPVPAGLYFVCYDSPGGRIARRLVVTR
jgi:subtilisin family serine protease